MEVFYKRDFNESYMILQGDAPEAGYEEEMLRQNQIHCLLTFYSMEMEGKFQLWYEITGKESLRDYLEQRPLDLELLDSIITYLAIAYQEISRYLLKQQHIYLNPDTIYIERSQKKTELKLCYCPMQEENFCLQFRQVMEYIIGIVDHEQEQLTRVCYDMYELTASEDYNLEGVAALLEVDISQEEDTVLTDREVFLAEERVEESPEESVEEPIEGAEFGTLKEIWDKIIRALKTWYQEIQENLGQQKDLHRIARENKAKNPHILHQQDVARRELVFEPAPEAVEATTLLREGDVRCVGRLQYIGDQEEDSYQIHHDIFRIGSRDSGNDANLRSEAVSRHHGKITRREDGYYLEDLNSTNGTYVNGELLSYHQAAKLSANDRIQFADVPYLFV